MTEHTIAEVHKVALTNAELGLLIIMLLEDITKSNGTPMMFEDIITGEKAQSDHLMTKLMRYRMPHRAYKGPVQ